MGLMDEINEKLKTAMREKDKVALDVTRALKSAIKYKKDETGEELDEEMILQVIQKEAKKRKDSIEEFKRGKRDDLVAREQAQLDFIAPFLPEEMGDAQIEAAAKEVIARTGATSKKEMGLVMKELMPALKGQADGRKVKQIVVGLLK